jgi:hypothetical protein
MPTRTLASWVPPSCVQVVLLPISDGLVLTSFAPLLVALLSPMLIREAPSRWPAILLPSISAFLHCEHIPDAPLAWGGGSLHVAAQSSGEARNAPLHRSRCHEHWVSLEHAD